jgi:biotin carboxylase
VPRVLLILARRSYRARAFLDAARSMGVDVTVASDHRASLGAMAPDDTLAVRLDDVPSALRRIESLAERVPFDAVLSAEDDGAVLAAETARQLGLRHAAPEAVRIARDKSMLRGRLAEAGLPGPWFRVIGPEEMPETVLGNISFPCVVKPLSLSASRGVIRVDSEGDFGNVLGRVRSIVDRAGDEPRVLVEGFLPGVEVAVEGVLAAGRLHTLALLDKPDPMDGPYFEETILVTPSRLPRALQEAAIGATSATASAIGLSEGPVHAELRIHDGGARLLEIAPRSIGGQCSRVLRFQGGRSLEEVLLGASLGEPPDGCRLEPGAAGVMMLPIAERGILQEVRGVTRARMVPGIESMEITIPPGQEVIPLPEGNRYLGFLFSRSDTPAEVEACLRKAHGFLDVTLAR